ncbi:hypothetical protein NX059_010652 [Plenodomus lindquistii]|nr:hypothetical protein NX059_010652 [Plenodomus lindquistii]
MQHLESLFEDMKKIDVDSAETEDHVRVPSPQCQPIPFIPQLVSPIHFATRDLPTPTDSYRPAPSPFLSDTEPVVRLAKHVYDSLVKDLENMGKEKQALQEKVKKLEHECKLSQEEDHANGTRLGLLKYQNEANRTQKADMGRALNDKEVKIKLQQLDIDELRAKLKRVEMELQAVGGIAGERDYFRDTLSLVRDEHTRALEEMTASKDQDFDQAHSTIRDLQATLTKITAERDAASRANLLAGDYAAQAQNLKDNLAKCEKLNKTIHDKLTEERRKVTSLEDEIEGLRARLDVHDIKALEEKLREKISVCDSQRSKLKKTERELKLFEERIMKVSNNGEALRGAAHLVAPHEKGKLPRNVISCSECYANNLTCDAGARCRSCTDRNTQCARWRCSLKHKLGNCPLAPCKLPHDEQGWLVLQQETRPQW